MFRHGDSNSVTEWRARYSCGLIGAGVLNGTDKQPKPIKGSRHAASPVMSSGTVGVMLWSPWLLILYCAVVAWTDETSLMDSSWTNQTAVDRNERCKCNVSMFFPRREELQAAAYILTFQLLKNIFTDRPRTCKIEQ
jgi:hypothetical protein